MGLFQCSRLVFGITRVIWQRTPIDQVLEGTSGVSCILGDMIITGKGDEEQYHGLRTNKAQCEFFKEKIIYCGYDIDSWPTQVNGENKSRFESTTPKRRAEVRSFLGLINFYHRFLPNLSTAVLNQLLDRNHKWKQCDEAFHKVKEMISSEQGLTLYDPSLPLRLVMHPTLTKTTIDGELY